MQQIKKLYIVLVLFAGFATQAQTITEKDLLGSWHMTKLDMNGYVVDLETGEVTPHDPANENSKDIEQVRQMFKGQMLQEFKESKTIFKPSGQIEMTEKGKSQQVTYELTEEKGVQLLHINSGDSIVMQVTMVEGLLKLNSPAEGRRTSMAMYLKKDE